MLGSLYVRTAKSGTLAGLCRASAIKHHLLEKQYEAEKMFHGGDHGNQYTVANGQNVHLPNRREQKDGTAGGDRKSSAQNEHLKIGGTAYLPQVTKMMTCKAQEYGSDRQVFFV